MNRKGIVPIIFIAIALALVIAFVGIYGGWKIISSHGFIFYVVGGGLIALTLIYGWQGTMNERKQKTMIALILVGVLVIVIGASGLLQTGIAPSGTYVQAPTFYYFECSPASEPIESTHNVLSTGSSNGWITAPSNTDQWDLYIRQTESLGAFSGNRRFVIQVCHNNGATCDAQEITQQSQYQSSMTIHKSNLLMTDRVYVDYQLQTPITLFQWKDQPNGAEWYQTYKPFIIWKVDMFGGGRTEYTSIEQGCNLPSNVNRGLLNSLTNSIKQINSQSTTSDTHIDFYKTRNFLGTFVPISTDNVNFVNYNGQTGYCLNRQIFAITTANTNGGSYQIVDTNFNTRLASSVPCCPQETQPNQKCGDDFQWHDIVQAQCSAFKPCAGADWMPSGNKQLVRYNCINSQCVAETKSVPCLRNADCGNNQICDTSSYTCINAGTGAIIPDTSNESSIEGINATVCSWGHELKRTKETYYSWYNIFHIGEPNVVITEQCVVASWISYIIFGGLGIVLIFAIVWLLKPNKKRRKK